MSSHPGSLGCRHSANVAAAAPQRIRRRQLHPLGREDLRKFARTDRGIRDETERPAHVRQKRPPVGIADIE